MKLTTLRHAVRESGRSLMRHPFVTLASMTTIAFMLLLVGSFVAFTMNARSIAEKAGQQPPVQVWVVYDADAARVYGIEQALKNDPSVLEYTKKSPAQNLEDFRVQLGADAPVLDGFDESLLSWSFTVRLTDPAEGESFSARTSGVPGVRKVDISLPVMDFLRSIVQWVNLASAVGILCLCIVALFIISNMVRVAVYSRSQEIGIMKYVGATNRYIRVPFVVEGAVVGISGGLAAWGLLHWGYSSLLQGAANPETAAFLTLLPLSTVSLYVLTVNVLFGLLVGSIGSALSVRRHVRV
jgi:cell division transport system permease protein